MSGLAVIVALCLAFSSFFTSLAQNQETLLAACYGPGLYGQKTASGLRLSHDTVGVAHRKWPMGSNLNIKCNGRTVSTRIIDRGPFCKGPVLDLTEATVKSLGFKNCAHFGMRPIKVER